MRINLYLIVFLSSFLGSELSSQTTTIINSATGGGFESGGTFASNGWTVVNGGQWNQWYVGNAATPFAGSNCALIGQATGDYSYNDAQSGVVHFYQNVTFPSNQNSISLTFKWKGQGYVSYSPYDYLEVFLVPSSFTPTANSDVANSYAPLATFGGQTNWQSASITIPCSNSGTTQRLIFSWTTSGQGGYQPPAAVDNISLTCTTLSLGTGVVNVGALPYTLGSGTTVGAVDDLTSANSVVCTAGYLAGLDQVYIFTPAASGNITASMTAISANATLSLYQGSPLVNCGGSGGTCVGKATGLSPSVTACVTSGLQYYLVLDSRTAGGSYTFTNLNITAPVSACNLGTGAIYVSSLPYNSGAGTTCGAVDDLTSGNTAVCGSTNYLSGEDQVFVFTPTTSGATTITLTSSGTWTGLMLYDNCPLSAGGCGGTVGTCVVNSQSSSGSKTISTCLTAGITYYLVLDSYGPPTCNAYSNLYISAPSSCNCGTGVVNIPALPYQSGKSSTYGSVDDLNSGNMVACGSQTYNSSEDDVYIFTPTTTGEVGITLESDDYTYSSLALYDGCPLAAPTCGYSAGTCVTDCQTSKNWQHLCATVTAGHTYYLVVDNNSASTGTSYIIYQNLTISAPQTTPLVGTTCANAPSITLPYTATGQTTTCYVNDYNNASTGSCGTLYEGGEDRVYAYTSAGNECISVTLANTTSAVAGIQVYKGCPDVTANACIASGGGQGPTLVVNATLTAAGTYYIVVDSYALSSDNTVDGINYDIKVISNGTVPANDLPCNATALQLGAVTAGDNSCAGNSGEPATPACWSNGKPTVWFSVACPASGNLDIRTYLGTITSTQIAVYTGTCGAGMTYVNCDKTISTCGGNNLSNSDLQLTGLTSGQTYYICVSGVQGDEGTFKLYVQDGNIGYPAIPGQDCSLPNPVCVSSIPVGDPGYQGIGNTCDFGGGGTCLTTGERGAAWYTINILNTGTLTFDIVPNDWKGSGSLASTDYDFAVWRIGGSNWNGDVTTCGGISGGVTPLSCNYSNFGVTGCYSAANGSSPASYPGFGAAYQRQITVHAGDVMLLNVSNYTNSKSGFTVNFGGNPADPINYTGTPTFVNWSGSTGTNWTVAANWGGCAIPTCLINANIIPAASVQPVLSAGSYNVEDVTIEQGATLTLLAGATLNVCGNFTNYGTLKANSGATIAFTGTGTQNINGALVGTNAFPNLTVTKTTGTVILNNDLDIAGSFTTSNGTSIFNQNGKYIKLAGNFTNNNGAVTFTGVANGTLMFNGSAAQTYSPGALFSLNNVIINQGTASTVTLSGFNMQIAAPGVLTLTSGRIVTNALEVNQLNTASAAVSSGNTNAYVDGNLRRSLTGTTTSYDFPVGNGAPAGSSPGGGYQRANITFTSATTIGNLLARFDLWGGGTSLAPEGQIEASCGANYSVDNDLDNGYWTISANATPTSGNYTTTLYSTNYSNAGGDGYWTVTKNSTGTWILDGTCDLTTTTPATVDRTGMNGFSKFAVAQSQTVLPIELINFSGKSADQVNYLSWETLSETNNHYFSVQRSTDAANFVEIGQVSGAGTSSTPRFYKFDDRHPPEGIAYYRLRQVDFNGNFKFSNIVTLSNSLSPVVLENIYPNPTTRDISFDFITPIKGKVTIVLTDVVGRIIFSENKSAMAGRNSYMEKLSDLSEGTYYIQVTFDAVPFNTIHKIIKQE